MDRASSLPFPGSRTLAQWWRRLEPRRPQALWVGYWYLHRVEAPVVTTRGKPLDPLGRLLLRALILEQLEACRGSGACLRRLQERMYLPGAVLQQMLRGLKRDGLVAGDGSGWWATERGRIVAERDDAATEMVERHVFPFAERPDSEGRRSLPPHYLPIAECPGMPWVVGAAEHFDPALLTECLSRPVEWKETFDFASAGTRLVVEAESSVEGRSVIVDRPGCLFLALVWTDADELLGFPAAPGGWTLFDDEPALRLSAAARSVWPALTEMPAETDLAEAWAVWCRQRSVPPAEISACRLRWTGGYLDVAVPARLEQRLRDARSDVFKGEAWLLPGAGHVRPAAALRLRTAARADADAG